MKKLSEAQACFADSPIDRLAMYKLLGAIYVQTCIRFEKLSLRKIVKEKGQEQSIKGKQQRICSVLVKSGLLLSEGKTNSKKYRWNKEKFGPVSLETADMIIKEIRQYTRTKANAYQRKRYATGKCYNSPQRKNKQNDINS